MAKLRNGSKGDSNPGSLDCESGILPLSYRAPQVWVSSSCYFAMSIATILLPMENSIRRSVEARCIVEHSCFLTSFLRLARVRSVLVIRFGIWSPKW